MLFAQVCGAMTSGGSESILSAMKSSRDFMRARRGIDEPEMIVAVSAHAAYWKAAEYFKIRIVTVGRGPGQPRGAGVVALARTERSACGPSADPPRPAPSPPARRYRWARTCACQRRRCGAT
jgi:sphinganine-1-phosphate aldolase